jgi:meso-butanediol dehydrogenase/(S,S)-butanediol dehydrogenase/diacetyl reductase
MIVNEFDGKVVVVTGGVSGMGEACTRRLSELGAVAVAVDRDADRGDRFIEGLGSPEGVEFAAVDITDRAALDELVAGIRSRHGRLDALINCAGIFTPNAPAADMSIDDFRRNFEVNLIGTMQAAQACYPLLVEDGGGAIVNVASQAALVSLPEQSAYTASKGAVAALTRSLAIDWARSNIRVNAVCPGFTRTPMSEPAITPELTRAIQRRVPLGRLFDAVELANVMLFLASPLASAVSGVVIAVDGGWTAGEAELPQW